MSIRPGLANGQSARQALFRAIVANFAPRAIVETGTYRATTTLFLARFGLPVFTIEANPRNYGFARTRLRLSRFGKSVTLLRGDSRSILRDLFSRSWRSLADFPVS